MTMATTMVTGAAAHMTDAIHLASGALNIRVGAKPGFRYWMTGLSLGFFVMRFYRSIRC